MLLIEEVPAFAELVALNKAVRNLKQMVKNLFDGHDTVQRASDLVIVSEEFADLVRRVCVVKN